MASYLDDHPAPDPVDEIGQGDRKVACPSCGHRVWLEDGCPFCPPTVSREDR